MKPSCLIISALVVAFSYQAFAQEYTDTTEVLFGSNITESYVNRTVDAVNIPYDGSAYNMVTNYNGRNVNTTVNGDNGTMYFLGYTDVGTFTLTADEGTWNTITMNGSNATIFHVYSMDYSVVPVMSISNTKVISQSGNYFLKHEAESQSPNFLVMNLSNVNFDGAKNQQIWSNSSWLFPDVGLTLNFSNGTNFDGFIGVDTANPSDPMTPSGNIMMDISSGSSWNVTQNSKLGAFGSLSLDGTATVSFEQLSEGTFTNITSVSIALEAGAILMLGATAEEIQTLMDGNGGTYDVNLFVTEKEFSNDGVVLVTSDGQEIEYTTDNLGNYILKSILSSSIPEPTTGALWLSAFGLFAFRRNKK